MSYKIISKIASGTFGTVYKVQNSTIDEFFALKLIHENYKNPKELKRIKRGFESAQKVSHPNCVKMIEWYEDGDDIGFVMEFVEMKEDLTGFQKPVRSGNLTDKISKIIQIANGLEALHEKGIVHRDLKPANILETKEGQIKITDFDLVKLDDASTITKTGAFIGTAKFSSPEQCQNAKRIDHRSDLYSLGILFYEMVAGRTPFEGDSIAEIALAHIRSPITSPKQFVPNLPNEIEAIITKLLEKDPNQRFSSAQEVAELLNTFLKKGEITNLETFSDFLLTPEFIGRKKEFSKLSKIFSEASNGKFKTVLISGEQGVGKTKFWKEFSIGLSRNQTLTFETNCSQNGMVFEPLQLILSKALEQIENLSAKEQAKKIGQFGGDLVRILPQIKNKFFIKFLPKLPKIDGQSADLRLFEAFANFLKNILSQNTTLVLFFDDLQWLDELSLKLLNYFSKSFSDNSVFIVGTFRNGEKDLTFVQKHFRSAELGKTEIIELRNFNLEEVREFLTKMLGKVDPVDTEFSKKILELTNGNILFVQEVMFHLLERKKLCKKDGNWDLKIDSFIELEVPKSIVSLVLERISFLDEDFILLLEIGSLLGKNFSPEIVAKVLSLEEKDVKRELADSDLNGILVKNSNGIIEFENNFFRESILNQIKPSRKKLLHRKIAEYFEKNLNKSDFLPELAIHFFEAGVKKKALEYSLKAGKLFYENQILHSALEFYSKAKELVENSRNKKIKLEIYERLANALNNLGKYEQAKKICLKAISLTPKLDLTKAKFLRRLGTLNISTLNLTEAKENLELSNKIYQKLEDLENLAYNFLHLTVIYIENGNFKKATEILNRVLEIGKELKIDRLIGSAYSNLGGISVVNSNWENAKKYYFESLKIHKRIGLQIEICACHFNIGAFYLPIGKLDLAKDQFKKSLTISEKFGYLEGIMQSKLGIATVLHYQKKYAEAINDYKSCIILADRIKQKNMLSRASISLAVNYELMGKFEESEKIFLEQLEISENRKDNSELTLGLLNLNYGRMLINSNQSEKAVLVFKKAIKSYQKMNVYNKLCESLYYQSLANFIQNDFYKAELSLSKAIALFNKIKSNESLIFKIKLLEIKIDFHLKSAKVAIEQLLEYRKEGNVKAFLPDINFELCNFYSKNPSLFFEKQIDFPTLKIQTLNEFKNQFKIDPKFELKKKIEVLDSLIFRSSEVFPELIKSLTNWMNPEKVFNEVLKFLQKETNAHGCQIILKNKSEFEISAVSPNLKEEEIDFSKTILLKAINENKPTLLKNVLEIPELSSNESVVGKIFLSVIAVPLNVENEVVGALYLDRTKIENGFFSASDLEKVETMAKILSPALFRQNEAMKMKINSEINRLGIFVGNSSKMQKIYSQIEEAASVNFSVYICGETGTGKELVAKALHKLSLRRNNPFIPINCSAIPKDLAESELFGHTKGAFSGAFSTKKGIFELASEGTLFLDEIAELSMNLQAKLLRAIQEKKIWRVGGENEIPIKTRIICATSKNLKEEVQKGNFREDLFYRLNILKIEVPPLRKRKEDIHVLAQHFLQKYCDELNKKQPEFSQNALIGMLSHDWFGNVRELENSIAKAVVSHKGTEPITLEEILDTKKLPRKLEPLSKLEISEPEAEFYSEEELVGLLRHLEGTKLNEKMKILKKVILKITLERHKGHKSKAAKELGISRKHFSPKFFE